tara:strand:+ start:2967 stop:3257 length:291 start_codon:yes stop_codon:yes gene_type:complete
VYALDGDGGGHGVAGGWKKFMGGQDKGGAQPFSACLHTVAHGFVQLGRRGIRGGQRLIQGILDFAPAPEHEIVKLSGRYGHRKAGDVDRLLPVDEG